MHLLTVRRIPIRLHSSFLLLGAGLVAWKVVSAGPAAAAAAVGLWTLVFASVLLHELGHALAGRLFGIHTRDITLYPFGGVARMEMGQLRPLPEVVVSLAGPAVNVALASLALGLLALGLPLGQDLLLINLGLGLFNLLPAYPMDGGRVLRALLSLRSDPLRATWQALRLSRVFGWAFVVAAPLLQAWSLLLVGGFLLLTIRAEQARVALLLSRRAAPPPRPRWEEPGPGAPLVFGHPVR